MKVNDIHRYSGYWPDIFSQAPAPTRDAREFILYSPTAEPRSEFPDEVSYNECCDPPIVVRSLYHLASVALQMSSRCIHISRV